MQKSIRNNKTETVVKDSLLYPPVVLMDIQNI